MELSEAFYSGLSLVDTGTLQQASSDDEAFRELYATVVANFKSGSVEGNKTSMYNAINKTNPTSTLYNDMAAAMSAVLGTRSKLGLGVPEAVFLTGSTWPEEVRKFQIDGFGMKDYNSSDVILRYGITYVGISLKKKPTTASQSPTLLNNSLATFLSGPELRTLKNRIDDIRVEFFANIVKEACISGPLQGIAECDNIQSLDPSKKTDAEKIWKTKVLRRKSDGSTQKVPLFNVKSVDELVNGGSAQTGVKDAMRKFVNSKLYSAQGGSLNPLFQAFLDVMSDPRVADTLADSILHKSLKLKLMDSLDTWQSYEYKFYLVEGVGRYTRRGPDVSNANVTNIHSAMIGLIMLSKLPTRMVVNRAKTMTGSRASVTFDLYKGDYPILEVILRYKGNFSSLPMFLATTTPKFKEIVRMGEVALR
tara:strand:- start:1986 stop:3248 length:1263 start_codon:yes stop_codon:yes gene_type:complete